MLPPGYVGLLVADTRRASQWELGLSTAGFDVARVETRGADAAEVEFDRVRGLDAAVDLVGAAVAMEHFEPERVTCGPVNVGGGGLAADFGRSSPPGAAAAVLLRGVPVYGSDGGELLTPTGAVLLAELVDEFVELPGLTVEAHGYGLGRKELGNRPNAFRLWRGTSRTRRGKA